ncbi:hypothetical protein VCX44_01900, partial [Aeromonas caviae]
KGKQGVMVGRKRLGDDGITWPEGGNINMMHGDSRVMVVVCLDSQFTSTLSVNFHFPKIPRRTFFYAGALKSG